METTLIMEKTIKKIDAEHIAVIETSVHEQLIAKVTLEAQKEAKLKEIADIDEMLLNF